MFVATLALAPECIGHIDSAGAAQETGIQEIVTAYRLTNFDTSLRKLAGTGRVQAIAFNGPTSTGKAYLIGCSTLGCDTHAGAVREFSVDTLNRTLTATGKVITLSNNGFSLNHPTGLGFIPGTGTVWVSDARPGATPKFCKINWSNFLARTGTFIERCVIDEDATPGGGARVEFVRVGTTWFLATADNRDTSGAGQTKVRLYDHRILATATRSSQALYASFLIPPLTQSMAYDARHDVLVLAQNTSTSPSLNGWRLRYVNLASSLTAGRAQYVAPYQDLPYNSDAIFDEFEGYRLVSSTAAMMTSNTGSLTDTLYAFAQVSVTTGSTRQSTTVELPTTADTRLEQKLPTINYASATTLWVAGDSNGACALAEAALKFSLSAVPAGKTITAATMKLYVTNSSSNGQFRVYSLKRKWSEGAATWKQWSAGLAWTLPGANAVPEDRGDIPRASFTGTPGTGGYELFPLNSAGVRQVQEWLDGVNPNDGFLVRPTVTSPCINTADDMGFESREGTNPPKLVVSYE